MLPKGVGQNGGVDVSDANSSLIESIVDRMLVEPKARLDHGGDRTVTCVACDTKNGGDAKCCVSCGRWLLDGKNRHFCFEDDSDSDAYPERNDPLAVELKEQLQELLVKRDDLAMDLLTDITEKAKNSAGTYALFKDELDALAQNAGARHAILAQIDSLQGSSWVNLGKRFRRGIPSPPFVCEKCGSENEAGTRYCIYCGHPAEKSLDKKLKELIEERRRVQTKLVERVAEFAQTDTAFRVSIGATLAPFEANRERILRIRTRLSAAQDDTLWDIERRGKWSYLEDIFLVCAYCGHATPTWGSFCSMCGRPLSGRCSSADLNATCDERG